MMPTNDGMNRPSSFERICCKAGYDSLVGLLVGVSKQEMEIIDVLVRGSTAIFHDERTVCRDSLVADVRVIKLCTGIAYIRRNFNNRGSARVRWSIGKLGTYSPRTGLDVVITHAGGS